MDASISPLQPDSAASEQVPDTTREGLQRLFDEIWERRYAPQSPDLSGHRTAWQICDEVESAIRAGRAAQAAGDGQ
jgi:hypothetical protein